jgi:hypothetical protein
MGGLRLTLLSVDVIEVVHRVTENAVACLQ